MFGLSQPVRHITMFWTSENTVRAGISPQTLPIMGPASHKLRIPFPCFKRFEHGSGMGVIWVAGGPKGAWGSLEFPVEVATSMPESSWTGRDPELPAMKKLG